MKSVKRDFERRAGTVWADGKETVISEKHLDLGSENEGIA